MKNKFKFNCSFNISPNYFFIFQLFFRVEKSLNLTHLNTPISSFVMLKQSPWSQLEGTAKNWLELLKSTIPDGSEGGKKQGCR